MKMTLPCSVVRDMLPLLADGLLSAESETLLREHLKSCDACRKMFEEMTEPEIMTETDKLELDYLKKVRGRRNRLVAAILLSVALVGGGVFVWLHAQAGKATVSYDEGSQTLVVYSNGEGKKLELPEEIAQAQTLDAQYDSFRMAMYLPLLSEADIPLNEYLPAYLERTKNSIDFMRTYLRENCADSYPAERADKYVELNIQPEGEYTWTELEDRIVLDIGKLYWHREELYILSMLGGSGVQWQQLGYAWYLGTCLNPYSEALASSSIELLKQQPYYDAYLRLGGTEELTPGNYRRMYDATAWLCLTEGMYWGSAYESAPLYKTALYKGPSLAKAPANEMSVCMATSFVAFLADEYGFSEVSAFCFGNLSFEQAFGTDFNSAYDAWSENILNTVG